MAKFVLVAIVTLFILSSMVVVMTQGQIHNTNRVLLGRVPGGRRDRDCDHCCQHARYGGSGSSTCRRKCQCD